MSAGAFACGPAQTAAPTPAASSDAFAVVRATAEAAYQAGRRHLERGELEAALIELDRARTNDPDSRPEIARALEDTLAQIQTRAPTVLATSSAGSGAAGNAGAVATAAAGAQATLVAQVKPTGGSGSAATSVAQANPTVAAGATGFAQGNPTLAAAQATAMAQANPTLAAAGAVQATAVVQTNPTVAAAATQLAQISPTLAAAAAAQATALAQINPSAASAAQATALAQVATQVPGGAAQGSNTTPGGTNAAAPQALTTWRDPQGRFSFGMPGGWTRADPPQALAGTPSVEFRDPSQRASLSVASEPTARAVSPELYAASLEIAMQQNVPGYATEQVVPSTLAGNPSVRRQFTFMQRDGSGQERLARAVQVTVLQGSTPFIITGSAPATDFAEFSGAFDASIDTFRFG